jgi:hypothetical protein
VGGQQSIFLEEKAEEICHIAAPHHINPIVCGDVSHSGMIYLIEASDYGCAAHATLLTTSQL